ncbi:hypothetical protein Y032_0236g3212 [Ancylostoma ceylanicum]|uniref:Uncharacterized protein n=1 Tax=Ancylostoma ceylanicum TaxID=53326 RepID=A0A016SEI9_9BILA|nr:hypothetical protein Y032_0236g3212 [Ancylostoma ceylanicum]
MAGANPSLTIAKQRLTRHINDIKHLIHECERYQEGWKFPSTCKELFVFIRTQRSSSATDSPNIPQVLKDFHIYWEEKEGDDILEMARELIQSLDMRLVELSTQELQVSYADEFDHLERQRTTMTSSELPPLVTPFTSQVDAPISGPSNSIPAHWYKKELRIPEFYGNPTDFQSFWEIFSELVDKQPYTDIEKLTILLEKCKGEAARALKFLPRKGSSYNDAKKQLKEQFENEELNVKLLLEQLERIPPSTEDASQLRATINDIMAIITPLSRSETHIDAREYKAKVRQKFPENIQRLLLSKEYDDNATIVKKFGITQVHTHTIPTPTPKATLLHAQTRDLLRYRCAACEGAHRIRFCNRYKTTDARRQRIQELRKCFKCFSTQHLNTQCSKPVCRYSSGQHNVALCYSFTQTSRSSEDHLRGREHSISRARHASRQRSSSNHQQWGRNERYSPHVSERRRLPSRSPSGSRRSTPESSNQFVERNRNSVRSRSPTPGRPRPRHQSNLQIPVHNVAAQEDEVSSDEELIHIHRIRVSSDSSDPRLMIIVVPLVDHVSRERTEVYALLDSGATRSFISEALASRLHLPLGTCSSYVLTTFGGKQEKKKSHAVSAQAISKNEGIFSMSLLTSEKITEKITLPRLSPDDIQHAISNQISEHTVLNPCEIEIEPEILLGIDYYTEVIDTSVPPVIARCCLRMK